LLFVRFLDGFLIVIILAIINFYSRTSWWPYTIIKSKNQVEAHTGKMLTTIGTRLEACKTSTIVSKLEILKVGLKLLLMSNFLEL